MRSGRCTGASAVAADEPGIARGYTGAMAELIFYSNPGCHLCEQANELLRGRTGGFTLRTVEIEGDLALVYRYGVRIPVLRRSDTGLELDWPFDAAALEAFLGA